MAHTNNNISEYEQQAIDFLNATSTAFKVKFIEHAPHFHDDKQARDIFRATFTNKLGKFSLRFGQSIYNSDGNGGNIPTAYDVLVCLTRYDVGTFKDFCSEFGYNTDSRKALKTYKAVCKEYANVQKLWTPEQIKQLQEIQ